MAVVRFVTSMRIVGIRARRFCVLVVPRKLTRSVARQGEAAGAMEINAIRASSFGEHHDRTIADEMRTQKVDAKPTRSSSHQVRVASQVDACVFSSLADLTNERIDFNKILDMSVDGGSDSEFQHYWRRNSCPSQLSGGWIEYCTHPQVNAEPYWFNLDTGSIAWQRPSGESESCRLNDNLEDLSGVGPAWDLGIDDLKHALANDETNQRELTYDDLARRAVAEYEKFTPRVLSWHDFQYNTFWFFPGMKKSQSRRPANSFFRGRGAGRELFADPRFFKAVVDLLMQRIHRMHPICLTYFVWTLTRAEVDVPEFMRRVGDYCCDGRLPMMDRCSLGTMVWNFARQSVRHDRMFECVATELARPNRVRSLAPRNFQNIFLAFGKRRHWNAPLIDALVVGARRLLDEHDPRDHKLDRKLLFSYICKDGSEVLADSWRISGLTVVLKAFHQLKASGSSIEACISSMTAYVRRSILNSPRLMREDGDACKFMLELLRLHDGVPELRNIAHDIGLLRNDLPQICEGAHSKLQGDLRKGLDAWSRKHLKG